MKPIIPIFCLIFLASPAWAQTPAATQPQPQPAAAAPSGAVSLADQFKGQLPFPLDETKMIAYVDATRRVKKINDKWDVQIAGADTDQRAIEYNNFSVEEITKSLQNIPGLTLDQYNAMTKLTATSADFNGVYLAYKHLLDEGKIKAPVAAAVTPVAAPVNPGTAAAPQGSPAPQYSPPVSH